LMLVVETNQKFESKSQHWSDVVITHLGCW
jgi:hypothetical protein